jgi:hypothetical protein
MSGRMLTATQTHSSAFLPPVLGRAAAAGAAAAAAGSADAI